MKAKLSLILAALLSGHVGRATYIPRAAPGTQFVTGPCTSDIECETACCGFNTGRCAGRIVAQTRDGGCGFGEAQPNDGNGGQLPPVETSTVIPPVQTSTISPPVQATPVSGLKPPGSVFITGVCIADSECETNCCGFTSGKCAGRIVAQTRDGGCGFGEAEPNDGQGRQLPPVEASTLLSPVQESTVLPPIQASSVPPAQASTVVPVVQATPVPGLKPPGSVFITGACIADSECETSCCGFASGKCAGPIIAQTRDGGCGFGNAQPNDDAVKKLRGL